MCVCVFAGSAQTDDAKDDAPAANAAFPSLGEAAKEEDASLVSSLPEEYRYASDEMSSSSSSEDSDEYDDDGYRRGRWTHRPADF